MQRGQESTQRVSREKTQRESDPRERERGKHQSSRHWAFSTFPLKRKKVFLAVGSKNRQEGGEAGGFYRKGAWSVMSHKRIIKGSHVHRRGLPVHRRAGAQRTPPRRAPPAQGPERTRSRAPSTDARGRKEAPPTRQVRRLCSGPSACPLLSRAGMRWGCGAMVLAPDDRGGGGAHVAAKRPARPRAPASALLRGAVRGTSPGTGGQVAQEGIPGGKGRGEGRVIKTWHSASPQFP